MFAKMFIPEGLSSYSIGCLLKCSPQKGSVLVLLAVLGLFLSSGCGCALSPSAALGNLCPAPSPSHPAQSIPQGSLSFQMSPVWDQIQGFGRGAAKTPHGSAWPRQERIPSPEHPLSSCPAMDQEGIPLPLCSHFPVSSTTGGIP